MISVECESIGHRAAAIDWSRVAHELDDHGCASLGTLLTASECAELVSLYDDRGTFRSTIVMARHGFGRGEYKYFSYPLPRNVAVLRTELYARLARIADRWERSLGRPGDYPPELRTYLERCHEAGQRRPTPLLLKYGEGDYNCLHQDLYGALVFPLQATFMLSVPGVDFTGGEFVLVEQRPRRQSRAEVVPLAQGEGIVFAVDRRPARGSRGSYRVALRHGVSRIRSGRRFTLGVIFHDAA